MARSNDENLPSPTVSYSISVLLAPEAHRLSASGVIEITNRSVARVSELWFHLYPNAFSNERTRFLRASTSARRSNRGRLYDPGYLEILQLSVYDSTGSDLWARADPTTPGDPDDTTDRRVPLPTPLEPGETLRLFVKFETKLPFLVERMGWVEDFLAVAQWFPKVAKLEEDGTWRHFPYEPLAEFSADFGNYDISITAPEHMIIAAAGLRSEVSRGQGRVTSRFQLKGVHDFAFFAWNRFERHERVQGDIRIRVFAPESHALNIDAELSLSAFGLSHFQNLFGAYPYSELVVVHPPDVAAPAGGMEYPGLIVTGGPWYATWAGSRNLQAVTLHEIAHQWFYGVVASDEERYPVLDEGLATWAEIESLTALYGEGSAFSGLGVTVSASALAAAIASLGADKGPLGRPASAFRDFSTLSATIYAKTALLLNTLASVYGTDKLERALRRYAIAERFLHPTPTELINAVATELGPEAAHNLQTALNSDGWVDFCVSELAVQRQGVHEFKSKIVLERRGTLEFPVEVLVKLSNGKAIRRTWSSKDPAITWEIAEPFPVASVMIDPDGKIAIENQRENNAKFTQGTPWPSLLIERLVFAAEVLFSGVLP